MFMLQKTRGNKFYKNYNEWFFSGDHAWEMPISRRNRFYSVPCSADERCVLYRFWQAYHHMKKPKVLLVTGVVFYDSNRTPCVVCNNAIANIVLCKKKDPSRVHAIIMWRDCHAGLVTCSVAGKDGIFCINIDHVDYAWLSSYCVLSNTHRFGSSKMSRLWIHKRICFIVISQWIKKRIAATQCCCVRWRFFNRLFTVDRRVLLYHLDYFSRLAADRLKTVSLSCLRHFAQNMSWDTLLNRLVIHNRWIESHSGVILVSQVYV